MGGIIRNRQRLPPCTEPKKGWDEIHVAACNGSISFEQNKAYEEHRANCPHCYALGDSLMSFSLEVLEEAHRDDPGYPEKPREISDRELTHAGLRVLKRLRGRNGSPPKDSLFLLSTLF